MAWALRLNHDETGWWLTADGDAPMVSVLPYQHIGHEPTRDDFERARRLALALATWLNEQSK